ncbi:MAG: phosphonoacetaldehyde hydrolase [Clostridia bacterium]|nr:phosphonoacetaldehyde hydrolase [Clostridia bacterium]NCD03442.1 phosphonoacetaldehyde hydrolase [Clostridia bacterium]
MKKIDTIIFDWAGTTVNYGSFAPVQAFIEAFKQFGVEPTTEEVRKPMGMLKHDHIRTMMQMPRISRLWEEKHGKAWTEEDVDAVYLASETGIMKILKNFVEPKPYVLDTVAELKKMGIKIGSTTGYTDEMMEIVVPAAKAAGYEPDAWFTPNAVGNMGRPYPYMIFKNMEALKCTSVERVMKVGDTLSDIKEGKNAGMTAVGIIEGSSVMGLSQEEYEAMSIERRKVEDARVREAYKEAGADYVIQDIRGVLDLIK